MSRSRWFALAVSAALGLAACSQESAQIDAPETSTSAPAATLAATTATTAASTTSTTSTTVVPATVAASTSTAPTTTAPAKFGDTSLLGGGLPAEQLLLFVSDDPAWSMTSLRVQYSPSVFTGQLLLIGDGSIGDRVRASISVGPGSQLDGIAGSSALMGAQRVPLKVGDVDASGLSTTVEGVPLSALEWPTPDEYLGSLVVVGLNLDQASDLAALVEFNGTTPTIDPPDGFRVYDSLADDVLFSRGHFSDGAVGIDISCANDGEVGLARYQMSALARTASRRIGGVEVAQRADGSFGPPQSILDGAAWVAGGWSCTVWSAPAGEEGGQVPTIAVERMEQFLTSLVIVDETMLRDRSPRALLELESTPPIPPPDIPSTPFSAGEAATSGLSALFAGDGTRVIAVGPVNGAPGERVAQYIDASTGELLSSVRGVVGFDQCGAGPFSPDGRWVFDGASVRDTTTGKSFFRTTGGTGTFSRNGSFLVVSTGRGNQAIVYRTSTGEELSTVTTPDYLAGCAQVTPDGQRILIDGLFPKARVWDAATGRELFVLDADYGFARLSPDGAFISLRNPGRLVDAATGELISQLSISPLAFSPDGSRLAGFPAGSGSDEPDFTRLMVWNLSTMQETAEMSCSCDWSIQAPDNIFNADGSRIVTRLNGVAEIHDTATGALVSTLELEDGAILSALFSPDGTRIVTANSDGTVRIWPAP